LGRSFFSAEQCRKRAISRLPYFAFDFLDGGAGREQAIAGNMAALARLRLVPRMLQGVHKADLRTTFLGQEYAAPFGIAPMGVPSVAWPGAEAGMAMAAAQTGIPFVLSNAATMDIGTVAGYAPGQIWYQLYHSHDVEHSRRLVGAAAAAGVKVLVLTVDRPVSGWRLRDLINGVGLDYKLDTRAKISLALHPRWSFAQLTAGLPRPVHMGPPCTDNSPVPLSWDYLRQLREQWPHTLLVKGILHPEDARTAVKCGADGIVVSNHGGAHLESVVSPIDCVPRIREAIGPDAGLVVDSGFRTGEDIAKGLAAGADFVLLGRAFAYCVAAAGPREGPLRMAQILADELGRVLALIGYPTPASLTSAAAGDLLFSSQA